MIKRIANFFKNVRYLSKFDLRKEGIDLRKDFFLRTLDDSLVDCIDNAMYLIPNSGVVRPNILNTEQTLDILCNSNKSLARFGDGELRIASGKGILFQDYDPILADRMKSILQNTNETLLVGISHYYFYQTWNRDETRRSAAFRLHIVPDCRKLILSLFNCSTLYCDSHIAYYFDGKNKAQKDKAWKKARSIWKDKKILLIGCKEAADNIKYDLFDNAQKSSWFYIPNKNAFSIYDEILKECLRYSKDTLIILMAGPTASVLADDLSKLGYRALDLGHVAKAYDWYLRGKEETPDFWAPDE